MNNGDDPRGIRRAQPPPLRRGGGGLAAPSIPEASVEIKEQLVAPAPDRGQEGGPPWIDRRGHFVGGRYELVDIIDSGGQGVVYRGLDRRDGDEVAVKVLKDSVARQADYRERLIREAHALAALSGTAAVRVLDQRWTDDGILCLVMELLRGADLQVVLERLDKRGVPFPLGGFALLFEPIVSTLERAHAQGILHRDVKPANIYVVDEPAGPAVKLLDFGFAKFIRMKSLTQAGVVAGSPSFIPPEMWVGERDIDPRIDVYSLAAVIFRTLTGRAPFAGRSMVDLVQLVTKAPRPSLRALRPELPEAVDDWAQQALAANRDERFTTVRGMYFAFCQAMGLAS